MNYTGKNHTFAICAYKESPFLEECIQSLLGQTIPSTIIIVTSTDNAYIQNMAEKYHLELFINHGESGITQDWMFAYRSARTELMTIAHQDDTYDRLYTETVLQHTSALRRKAFGAGIKMVSIARRLRSRISCMASYRSTASMHRSATSPLSSKKTKASAAIKAS